MAIKVLLDTDIGGDVDDAVALAYLLANPECDLLGITTVTGDTVKRASVASVLCKLAGKRIPIHPGKRKALLVDKVEHTVPQAAALDKWDHDTNFSRNEAIPFMRQTIRDNPGEVVLLSIGPLSNLAALFAADEEVAGLLKGLVVMGGSFLSRATECEWNAYIDPTATAMAYGVKPPWHRSIGLDVTNKVTLPAEEARKRFSAPVLRPVLDFAEVWFQQHPTMWFHDPIAAVSIFDEGLCGYETGRVEVELKSDRVAGTTLWYPKDPKGYHQVATTIDPQRFFDHYFSFFK